MVFGILFILFAIAHDIKLWTYIVPGADWTQSAGILTVIPVLVVGTELSPLAAHMPHLVPIGCEERPVCDTHPCASCGMQARCRLQHMCRRNSSMLPALTLLAQRMSQRMRRP